MRKLVAFVILLVAAKFGYHEYMYRAATREVIVGMVQERALQQCQRHAKLSVVTAAGTPSANAWSRPASVALKIGKSGLDVYPWQINSAQWNARYRNPYLLIVAEPTSASLACEYDILNGSAQVYKL
jgi:hypothetical protein